MLLHLPSNMSSYTNIDLIGKHSYIATSVKKSIQRIIWLHNMRSFLGRPCKEMGSKWIHHGCQLLIVSKVETFTITVIKILNLNEMMTFLYRGLKHFRMCMGEELLFFLSSPGDDVGLLPKGDKSHWMVVWKNSWIHHHLKS